MSAEAWIAMAALVFTMFTTTVGATTVILTKINRNKEALDQDLDALRMSAYEEYKTLRREIAEVSSISRREFGESVAAIREKVTQVELWIRDQLSETRHTLTGSMDMRYSIIEEKLDGINERLRELELSIAARGVSK